MKIALITSFSVWSVMGVLALITGENISLFHKSTLQVMFYFFYVAFLPILLSFGFARSKITKGKYTKPIAMTLSYIFTLASVFAVVQFETIDSFVWFNWIASIFVFLSIIFSVDIIYITYSYVNGDTYCYRCKHLVDSDDVNKYVLKKYGTRRSVKHYARKHKEAILCWTCEYVRDFQGK